MIIFGVSAFIIIYKFEFNFIFDKRELEELYSSYDSKPLMNIISSDNVINLNETIYPLFGGYKGLREAHSYANCKYAFEGSCENDDNKYCDENKLIDKKSCVNYLSIKAFNYTYFKGKYYYSQKTGNNYSYDSLLNYTIKEGQKCPEKKKMWTFKSRLCFMFSY